MIGCGNFVRPVVVLKSEVTVNDIQKIEDQTEYEWNFYWKIFRKTKNLSLERKKDYKQQKLKAKNAYHQLDIRGGRLKRST